MEKPEEVRLIDLDETHSGEHTVFIMPPEEPQEPDGSECPALYRYGSTLGVKGGLSSRVETHQEELLMSLLQHFCSVCFCNAPLWGGGPSVSCSPEPSSSQVC